MRKKLTRTIMITGATGDIAQALIKRLSGDQLILLSRKKEHLKSLYEHLPNVILMTNEEVLLADQSVSVDILINNAGFGVFKPLTDLSEQEITEQFAVNTFLPIQLIRKVQPNLQVVNIASIAGKIPTAKSTIYAASKAALIAFSDALRMENPQLIVTVVNTGPVRTNFHKNNGDYLKKVGKNAITAEFVADRIVRELGKRKREIILPWRLKFVEKFRALFPKEVDFLSIKFFNYK